MKYELNELGKEVYRGATIANLIIAGEGIYFSLNDEEGLNEIDIPIGAVFFTEQEKEEWLEKYTIKSESLEDVFKELERESTSRVNWVYEKYIERIRKAALNEENK